MKLTIPLIMAVAAILVFTGCASPAPAPAPAPTPAPTPAPSPAPSPAPGPAPAPSPVDPLNPFGANFAVKPDGTPFTFVLSIVHMGGGWSAFAGNIWQEYMSRAGTDYSLHSAERDAGKMVSDLEDFIVMNPDGVFIQATDTKAAVIPTENLMNAGIPVFGWDVLPETDNITATIDYIDSDIGKMLGQWVAEDFDRRGIAGRVYVCQGMLAMAQTMERHNGFLEGIKGSNVEVVGAAEASWMDEPCANLVTTAFTADPTLNCFFSHGGMIGGGVQALEAMGRLKPVDDPDHVVAVVIGEGKTECELIRDGKADAVASMSPFDDVDYMVKQALWYVVLGQPVQVKHLRQDTTILDQAAITADYARDPSTLWGVLLSKGLTYPDFPVLDNPYIGTPTLADRQKLMGY